jgi:hypothetical protein
MLNVGVDWLSSRWLYYTNDNDCLIDLYLTVSVNVDLVLIGVFGNITVQLARKIMRASTNELISHVVVIHQDINKPRECPVLGWAVDGSYKTNATVTFLQATNTV